MDYLNRFDRIVAILIQLQSKRVVKAQELAKRFDVSLRTVYRDIRSLEAGGIPIIGEAGRGYSIVEGYRLPPVMFTKEEAGSFVAAEKLMQEFSDKSLSSHFESAIYKIKSILRNREKDWIDSLDHQIVIHPRHKLFTDNTPDALLILFDSIAEKKQVVLKYISFSSDEATLRNIEPVGIFYENNYWHIMAFCHLRKDYRQFRTDRIQNIEKTEIPFDNNHGPINNYKKTIPESLKTKVIITIPKTYVKYIRESRKYYGFVSEKETNEMVEMTFMSIDPYFGLARWYLMIGDCATIIEPQALKEYVKALLEKIKANL